MDTDISLAELLKGIGLTGFGGLALLFFLRFFQRKFIEEGTNISRAGGETDVITILRTEVDRLANLNATLSTQVTDLTEQVIALRGENAELRAEVSRLNAILGGKQP